MICSFGGNNKDSMCLSRDLGFQTEQL